MSNLIKSGVVAINSKEKRVIDSDSLFSGGFRPLVFERVEEIEDYGEEEEEAVTQEETLETEEGGLTPEQTDLLFRTDSDEAALKMLMGNNGDSGEKKSASPKPDPKKQKSSGRSAVPQKEIAAAKEEAEKILADARLQAEEILEQAQTESQELAETAQKQGYDEGYQKGQSQLQAEIEEAKQELEAQEQRRQEEYAEKISALEPQIVTFVSELVKKLTGVVLSDRKDIITYLVSSCLEGIERSSVYLIHVSKEDLPDLQDKKTELEQIVGETSEIKIVEDDSLGKNQCLIESDTAIYDSSLDLQLERLCEDLKILSLNVDE